MGATARERVARHRKRLLAAGRRPLQIWVPDTRRPGFAQECRRQSTLLREDPLEREILAFLEEAADREDWD